ncbi:MAG: mandelate racemase/muconate lactonizing enzyme family protein [Acidimicrobiia bacterium]|nr:mandelate racemase/muconate lactonizing enzyme family protein [Acidimicrobiia bacterium]
MTRHTRRQLLTSLAGATAGVLAGCVGSRPTAGAALQSQPPQRGTKQPLKITDVKTAMLEAQWGPWKRQWLLVRIDTNQGISGYGDTWASPEVKSLLLGYKSTLVGQDPANVEALFRQMVSKAYAGFTAAHFDGGLAVHAVSALETALWDIAGKAANLPVYQLLGGRHRERVRLYCCVGFIDDYLKMEDVYKKLGITCLKFDATPPAISNVPGAVMDQHLTRKGLNEIVSLLEKIRQRVGSDREISVECRVGTLSAALRYMKAVEPFDLTWVEDPIPPTDVDAWATLTASSKTPTLTGEGLHLRHEFLEYFRKSALRIAAPDFQICGGLAEGKKIAEMADLHHLLTCPHNASSAIGIAAAVHACAAIPNFLALEFHAMPGWDRILSGYRPKIADGHMEVPEGPGLGVTLDEQEAQKYLMKGETWFG